MAISARACTDPSHSTAPMAIAMSAARQTAEDRAPVRVPCIQQPVLVPAQIGTQGEEVLQRVGRELEVRAVKMLTVRFRSLPEATLRSAP